VALEMTTASPAPLTWSTRIGAVQLRALLVGGLVSLELLLGPLAVHFSPPGTQVAMFWPSAGVSVAALALAHPSWRSSVLAGIFAVTAVANYAVGRPLDISLGFGLANAAGAATAIWLLTRGGRKHPQLQNLDDFFRLLAAAVLAAGVSGGVAAGAVALMTHHDPLVTWRTLLASHGAAILLIAPMAMQLPRHAKQAGVVETVLQWASLFGIVALIFRPDQGMPLAFLPFPLLVWGAARLSPREVTVQLLAFFTVVCALTSAGLGPVAANIETNGAPADLIGTLLQAQVLAAVLVALPLSLVKTQQLITVDRLTNSHSLVSNILEATTATAILGTDLDGRIEFFNIGAERMTGYRADEVIGRATVALVDFGDGRLRVTIGVGEDPDTRRLTTLVGPFLSEDEGSFTSDWDFVTRDGGVRTISVAISRRLGDDGQPIGFLGVADDVTERRRHEAMVEAALETEKQIVERLAQVDQTKNDFLSTVSHELRTPITSIIGYSQLLASDDTGALPAMHQQIVSRIERNGRRLMGLIEDMLTMSQVEVGSFSFEKTPIDLRDSVCNAVEAVHGTVAVHDLELDLHLGLEAVKVYGDPDKLERVFVNLLSNAAKFSHAGDRISVRLDADGDDAVLSVVDSGIGIGPEDQAHLFDRFFRGADAHALAIQGVGLGLPIASSIVAGHDGRIDVISELGRGSTFVVRLPLLGDAAA
jgi:signal transduction histidine kinase/integral membrane sensor domain MASE1